MNDSPDPYDEFPYRSRPIEWSAPERLALTSMLHGGPRMTLEGYRVLELGCGDGANLLPLAYYRRHARFVGVDGARSQIHLALARKAALGLGNLEFIHSDFLSAAERLTGQFDFILAHGVFSWVSESAQNALLRIFEQQLRRGGLLYLNYNTRPGWDVRGLVRDFLLAQTSGDAELADRARAAKEVADKIAAALAELQHPYSQLMANEFRFVAQGDASYVGHEFLSPENHAFWRSEFLSRAREHGLEYVGDADFNYPSGRTSPELAAGLSREKVRGRSPEDTQDLLCYRQLHSPILTPGPLSRTMPSPAELGRLFIASPLDPGPPKAEGSHPVFKHPSGYEVEAKEEWMRVALAALRPLWPRGVRLDSIFEAVPRVLDDLTLLHRNGLVELRCIEPADGGSPTAVLNGHERQWGGYFTTPYHQTGVFPEQDPP